MPLPFAIYTKKTLLIVENEIFVGLFENMITELKMKGNKIKFFNLILEMS